MPDPNHLPRAAAASYLGLDEATVDALVQAGFLAQSKDDGFTLADLKAFVARNADNGSGNLLSMNRAAGPEDLLAALDARSGEMALRAFDVFSGAFPETRTWSLAEQARFVDQARNRFEAILAVTSEGSVVDEALVGDLREVGAAAAEAGSPLPQLLAMLRISRDLIVQTAVELADERGGGSALALSLLLTRILPTVDRLTDALAQGHRAGTQGAHGAHGAHGAQDQESEGN